MAVFEYRGLVAATGKQVHGVRDADNAKVLRAMLKREGVLLTQRAGGHDARRPRRGGTLDFVALVPAASASATSR